MGEGKGCVMREVDQSQIHRKEFQQLMLHIVFLVALKNQDAISTHL